MPNTDNKPGKSLKHKQNSMADMDEIKIEDTLPPKTNIPDQEINCEIIQHLDSDDMSSTDCLSICKEENVCLCEAAGIACHRCQLAQESSKEEENYKIEFQSDFPNFSDVIGLDDTKELLLENIVHPMLDESKHLLEF